MSGLLADVFTCGLPQFTRSSHTIYAFLSMCNIFFMQIRLGVDIRVPRHTLKAISGLESL